MFHNADRDVRLVVHGDDFIVLGPANQLDCIVLAGDALEGGTLEVSHTLLRNLVDIGAVGVEELTSADWQSLPSWRDLRMLQKRRLMQALFGPRASWSLA